ncbi:MerR family transcriptional regulator [Herbidospora galbida]|uniref:MerR family transcriptional regulator n=1 Tax=Herbidospora galbida TaxID=2575442 RepID=A0A4U3MDK0_9ACTN|nr:MerR family transcriptional regulator [Herbidospora galbida]TKK85766.1 MerR family transcriptional regulator [Herbidospora galbida]
MWTIGQLAQATRTTVRALRHYDEIGLLRPTGRTPNGHRRYGPEDLRRLYRIRSLRTFGMSLEEIATSLEAPGAMETLLHAQLALLSQRAAELDALRAQLTRLLDHDDPDDYLKALEMTAMLDAYFTPEQQDSLTARREALGPEAVESAKGEFRTLVEALLACVRNDVAPDSPEARDVVAKWDALGAGFHAAGTGTETATRRMWDENSEEISARLPWSTEELRAIVSFADTVRANRP